MDSYESRPHELTRAGNDGKDRKSEDDQTNGVQDHEAKQSVFSPHFLSFAAGICVSAALIGLYLKYSMDLQYFYI